MWRQLRITILLLLLVTVAVQAWRDQQVLKWRYGLNIVLYPINADGSASVKTYLQSLRVDEFAELESYFSKQAAIYGLAVQKPVTLYIGPEVKNIPPAPPKTNSAMTAIVWSLKFRAYAWLNSPDVAVKPDIRMYLLYHDPKNHNVLSHSTALSKGRIGRVNLYGDTHYNQQNLVIVAHELLHTLNASDKYDLLSKLPYYPDGYAEPEKLPLYPQTEAELMAGRIPRTENRADIPKSLNETSIGEITAREIRWLK